MTTTSAPHFAGNVPNVTGVAGVADGWFGVGCSVALGTFLWCVVGWVVDSFGWVRLWMMVFVLVLVVVPQVVSAIGVRTVSNNSHCLR